MKISEALNLDGLSQNPKEVFNTCEIEPYTSRVDRNLFSRKLKTSSVGEVVAYINEDFYLDSSNDFDNTSTILGIVDILTTMKIDGGYIIRNNENDIEVEFIWYSESFKIRKDKGYYILRDYGLGFGNFGSGEMSVDISHINGINAKYYVASSEENSISNSIIEAFKLGVPADPRDPHVRQLVHNAVSYLDYTLKIHNGYAIEINKPFITVIFPNENEAITLKASDVQLFRGGFHDYIADEAEISPVLSSIGFFEKDEEDFKRLNANLKKTPSMYLMLRVISKPSIGDIMAVINNEFELDPDSPFSAIDTAIEIHELLSELEIYTDYHITDNSDSLEISLRDQKGTIIIWKNKGRYFRKSHDIDGYDDDSWDGEYYGEDC